MLFRFLRIFVVTSIAFIVVLPIYAQKTCFTAEARAQAERTAKVWQDPAGYDPVLGYVASAGPRLGAPPVDDAGLAKPIVCTANKDNSPGSGTTPKFHCSVAGVTEANGDLIRYKVKPHFKGASREKRNGEVYGEFLASRFSKAVGFFADNEWVADVTCSDCEKSLTSKFQGTPWNPFQLAAGIELPLGKGIDVNCDDKDSAPLDRTLAGLLQVGSSRAEIDAFKLWLAFIDHGDTKTDNQKFTCLDRKKEGNTYTCPAGMAVYYVSDMGSTFGHSADSEKKATLERWKQKDPIEVKNGRCTTTAKGVGNAKISEPGRALLARELRRLLDSEKSNGTITKVFAASRNAERDQPAEAWTVEFTRRANTIINAKCSN